MRLVRPPVLAGEVHGGLAPRRWRVTLALALAGLFLWAAGPVPRPAQAQTSVFDVDISTTTAMPVDSGVQVCFTVSYAYSSTVEDATNATITVPIPSALAGLDFYSGGGSTPHIASANYDSGTGLLTWTMISPMPSGSSGILSLCTHFPNGSTPDGTSATIKVTFQGDQGMDMASENMEANATPKVTINKTIAQPPALDQNATYIINISNPYDNGGLNLSNLVVTDVLPAGAIFVRASNGGTESGGTVTWNIASLNVGDSINLRLTIKYPSGTFALDDVVTNCVDLAATAVGGVPVNLNDCVDATISPPNPVLGVNKYGHTSKASRDGGFYYYFDVNNQGNVELSNVVLEDSLPPEYFLQYIALGLDYYGGSVNNATVEYKTTANPVYTTWPMSPFQLPPNPPFLDNTYLNVSSLGLAPGEVITDVKVTFDTVEVGYTNGSTLHFFGSFQSPDRDGMAVTLPKDVKNTVNTSFVFDGNTTTGMDMETTTMIDRSPKPVVYKSLGPYYVEPTNFLTFYVRLTNNWDGSLPLDNPTMADLLPQVVDYVGGSLQLLEDSSGVMGLPTEVVTPNYHGSGRTHLKWSWPGKSLPVGNTVLLLYQVQVKAGTPEGAYYNRAYFTGSSNTLINDAYLWCVEADVDDIDDDGDTTEQLGNSCNQEFYVRKTAAIESIKLVKGELDAQFHKYPEVGLTNANGTFEYKLTVQNVGNTPLTNVRIMDILPKVGDVGVVTFNGPRQSEYTPYIVTPVTGPGGTTILYSTSANPCRQELDSSINPDSPSCDSGTFSATLPPDITDVRSMMFDFGSQVLNPLDSFEFGWTMQAPVSVVPGQVAWNSFAHRSEAADGSGLNPPPAEPIKVGVTVPITGAAKIGNFVWHDNDASPNGIQDGEPGVPGVTVELLDASGNPVLDVNGNPTTTVTDGSGMYMFGVPAGTYKVKFTLPSGYAFSPANQGGDDELDSDVDTGTGVTTDMITVALGDMQNQWDAGIFVPQETPTPIPSDTPTPTATDVPTFSLGNLVFKDLDNDGLFEPGDGEFGIDGVKLNLYVDDGDSDLDAGDLPAIDMTTTSGGGLYLFSGLAPGNYLVEVDPSNFAAGGPLENMPTSTGNDPAPEPNNDVNNDDNGTDIAGFGVANAKVISLGDIEPVDDGDTDDTSNLTLDFGFINLPTPTPTATNTDEPTATPTDEPTATPTDEPTLTPTETPLPSATPTNAPQLSLGNLVFKDLDNDGLYEPGDGEFGINAVLVNLYLDDGDGLLDAGDGAPIASQSTAGGGSYQFMGLSPGSYIVEVDPDNLLAGGNLEGMPSSTGNDPAPDPDDDVNNDDNGTPVAGFGVASAAIDLSDGAEPVNDGDADPNSNLTVDFGFWQPLCLGNLVFKDLDNDGLFEPGDGEFGIDGVKLNLYLDDGDNQLTVADGAPIAMTTTAGGGLYSFENLTPGAYIVAVDPSAFAAGGALENMPSSTGNDPVTDPDDDVDNDDNGSDVAVGAILVVATQAVTLSVGGEPDKPVDGDGVHCNQTVDLGFTNPEPTPTPTPTDTPTPTQTPQPQLLCLGDLVFYDLDNDGIFEPGNSEFPLDGVKLNLYLDDGDGVLDAGDGAPIAMDVTSGGGLYEFCNLQPGDYIVAIDAGNFAPGEVLDGLQSSTGNDLAGMAPDPDDDANNDDNGTLQVTGDVASKAVTLAAGTEPDVAVDGDGTNSNHTVDFGLIRPAPPTGLLFGGLTVKALDDGRTVTIRWETRLEEDLLGFRVERSNFAGGPWTAIGGGKLIAAKDARAGASYAVTDRPGSIGRFYYRVVAVSADGAETHFGPAGLTLGRWLPVIRPFRLVLPFLSRP